MTDKMTLDEFEAGMREMEEVTRPVEPSSLSDGTTEEWYQVGQADGWEQAIGYFLNNRSALEAGMRGDCYGCPLAPKPKSKPKTANEIGEELMD